MTKRPSPERLLQIFAENSGPIIDELFAEIDYLRGQVEDCTRDYWAASEERKQIREERDLLKERLGPAGAEEIVRLKRELDEVAAMAGKSHGMMLNWKDYAENLREALISISVNWLHGRWVEDKSKEALALARPGEDEK